MSNVRTTITRLLYVALGAIAFSAVTAGAATILSTNIQTGSTLQVGGSVGIATPCPTLTRTLMRSSRGVDVVALQQFLIAQGLLSNDSGTGYFGSLTQGAVQKFQASQNIVSSGTPSSTGYGLVGAKTRRAFGLVCTHTNPSTATSSVPKSAPPSSLQPQCPLVALPIGKACTGTWEEVKDTKGCTASWQCSQ